jgi:predicted transposase/invertase (TIGR01784 family)
VNLLYEGSEKNLSMELAMKTKKQKPAQYEWGPFPFEGGTQIFDIRYDPVFKAVFTKDTPTSRSALSDLISTLIDRVVTVERITANEPPINDLRQKYIRFDISCKTKEGEFVNVEMSFNPKPNELARLEYYTTIFFSGQDIHGNDKNYDDLKETYQIAIIAKEKFFTDKHLIHDFSYSDLKTRVSLGGKTRIITVELVKTRPIAEKPIEEMTDSELWAIFFQYLTDEEKRAKIVEIRNRKEGIAMAVKTMMGFTQSEIEHIRKMSELKAELDYQDGMVTAKRKGHKEGLEKGLAEGLAEGLVKGRNEEKLENARKMKIMGFLTEQIQAVTGLSVETIEQL